MGRKERISMAMKSQILVLKRRGYSIRKIADVLQKSRRTIRRCLRNNDDLNSVCLDKSNHIDVQHDEETLLSGSEQPFEVKYALVIDQFPQWLQDLDWVNLLHEQGKGVPVNILWEEAKQEGCPVKYWAFSHAIKRLSSIIYPQKPENTCVRLVHNPGEKVFVDYCDGLQIMDKISNKKRRTHLFAGVFPFSGMVFAEFVFDQSLPSFIKSFENMWQYFNGVSQYVVCDNLKSAVTKAHIYDPDVNKVFCEYANYAGFAVIPARPRKPKDKASVERHVGILQESFFQIVRNRIFYNIEELNFALKEFLNEFNAKEMKDYGVSRLARFEEEKKHLSAFPIENFEISKWRLAKVNQDGHIQAQRCFYSVPWAYISKEVNVKISYKIVEIFDVVVHDLVAVHPRLKNRGDRSTIDSHLPLHVKEHIDFNMEKAKKISAYLGENIYNLVCYLESLPHPLQYLRRIQGLLRMYYSKDFSNANLEFATQEALSKKVFKLSFIKEMAIKNMLDTKIVEESNGPKRIADTIFSDPKYERKIQL